MTSSPMTLNSVQFNGNQLKLMISFDSIDNICIQIVNISNTTVVNEWGTSDLMPFHFSLNISLSGPAIMMYIAYFSFLTIRKQFDFLCLPLRSLIMNEVLCRLFLLSFL